MLSSTVILLEKDFPNPMQSCREGLIPFPYADSLSLIDKSRDKNKKKSTCTHLAPYTTSVYPGCSTTTHVHQDLCHKIKLNVGFPCHDRRSLILGLPYTRNSPTWPFSCILKAIKKPILSYGKVKEFNFEIKVTLETLLLH